MEMHEIQILESFALLVIYVAAYFVTRIVINNALKNTHLQRTRRKMIVKAVHLFTTIVVLILLAGIWGFRQNVIVAFASTILTALGIAFFAQWSLLSNITSSIILFFNHPLKKGDTIRVLDKDFPIEGEITDLTYFFVHLRTTNGEILTVPNSLILQKAITVEEKKSAR